jgi:ferredoxin-NADP reductase/predicted pyridoxine 5'-phosphate oxidase superfamily flavin-nucleotide-binding protein
MARSFADIAFTEGVRAFQARMGSRDQYAALDGVEAHGVELGDREAEFIAARDGFYQATVGETGWPYVQFRGGPAGFLKVLDPRTIGYADFRGNVQYISAGNLQADGRVSLILMDYANRRRLKVWGRARLVDARDDNGWLERLEVPSYRARIERAVIISVEAFDWNCPQHITPRYTAAEIEAAGAGPGAAKELADLRAEVARLRATGAHPQVLGQGPLSLVVTAVRQLTSRVRSYTVQAADGGVLPAATAGAHLDVPVVLPDGRATSRRYSIATDPASTDAWDLAVLAEPEGTGGSLAAHRLLAVSTRLNVHPPSNDFALHDDARPAVLIAGGIGITPLRAMAHALRATGRDHHLHYAGRSLTEMAWADELQRDLGPRVSLYPADAGTRLDLDRILADAPADAVFYVCGPARLLASAQAVAKERGLEDRLRFERFSRAHGVGDAKVTIELRRSGLQIEVLPDATVLEAIEAAGIAVPASCRAGTCGTCATKVLEGLPDHRDSALTPEERTQAGLMCVCVSRALTPRLALDL